MSDMVTVATEAVDLVGVYVGVGVGVGGLGGVNGDECYSVCE